MKRFLSILLVCLVLCAACAMGASAAEKVAFNPSAIQKCMFLVDTNPAIGGFGHCGMVLADKNGHGILYSFQSGGLWSTLVTPSQLTQFLKDGLIPDAISKFQFDKVIVFDILPEEGRRMYDYAATHKFRDFYMYASFFTSFIPIGDNCLSFVHSTMAAGSRKYNFLYPFGVPLYSFYTLQLNLRLYSIPYTTYTTG